MKLDVNVIMVEELPLEKIKSYEDLCIFGIARQVLDITDNDNRFPILSKALEESSMAQGVTKEANCVYWLGTNGTVNYAEYVWNMPEGTHWTNDQTYAQWYVKVYNEKKELITQNAIDNVLRSVK